MKKILILFMLLGFLGQSCKKEFSRTVKQEDKPQVNLELDDNDSTTVNDEDDQQDLIDLANPDNNDHSVYSFGGVAGVYFGCTSTFKVKGKASLEIILGTSLTTNLKWTQSEFEELIKPGERTFGSLGSFSTFPEMIANRVEIAFTDKKSRRWCSTRISERRTDHGVEASIKVDQSEAIFVIDDIHKIEIAAETEGYRLKGHFDCLLYEVNGKGKKKIKGSFTGIVSHSD